MVSPFSSCIRKGNPLAAGGCWHLRSSWASWVVVSTWGPSPWSPRRGESPESDEKWWFNSKQDQSWWVLLIYRRFLASFIWIAAGLCALLLQGVLNGQGCRASAGLVGCSLIDLWMTFYRRWNQLVHTIYFPFLPEVPHWYMLIIVYYPLNAYIQNIYCS